MRETERNQGGAGAFIGHSSVLSSAQGKSCVLAFIASSRLAASTSLER
jgi:hypothetical protein